MHRKQKGKEPHVLSWEKGRIGGDNKREGSVEIQSKNFKEQGKSNGSHGNCKDEQIMNSTILIKKTGEEGK